MSEKQKKNIPIRDILASRDLEYMRILYIWPDNRVKLDPFSILCDIPSIVTFQGVSCGHGWCWNDECFYSYVAIPRMDSVDCLECQDTRCFSHVRKCLYDT